MHVFHFGDMPRCWNTTPTMPSGRNHRRCSHYSGATPLPHLNQHSTCYGATGGSDINPLYRVFKTRLIASLLLFFTSSLVCGSMRSGRSDPHAVRTQIQQIMAHYQLPVQIY